MVYAGTCPQVEPQPLDLVFESPNLSTIKLIKAGKNPYAQDMYSIFTIRKHKR